MTCAICGIRKPKRHCPGVHGDICTVCCATEREQTVDCPLDCEFLQAAHRHEKPPELDPAKLPDRGIEMTDEFIDEHQMLVLLLGSAVLQGALKSGGATDHDAIEALDALIKTYKTLDSGLYYESVPNNPYAAQIFQNVQAHVADLRRRDSEARGGASTLRDAQVYAALTILERLAYANSNGRRQSRSFLDFLGRAGIGLLPDLEDSPEPQEPRVIL
ncbi:MAG: hypothetical protein KGN84_04370 [Acidobacteriota bacterium]|nr:hypothetical protein [Acidobacteriota bacterium]